MSVRRHSVWASCHGLIGRVNGTLPGWSFTKQRWSMIATGRRPRPSRRYMILAGVSGRTVVLASLDTLSLNSPFS